MSQQNDNVLIGQSRNVLLTRSRLGGGQRTTFDGPSRTRPAGDPEKGQEEIDHAEFGIPRVFRCLIGRGRFQLTPPPIQQTPIDPELRRQLVNVGTVTHPLNCHATEFQRISSNLSSCHLLQSLSLQSVALSAVSILGVSPVAICCRTEKDRGGWYPLQPPLLAAADRLDPVWPHGDRTSRRKPSEEDN